MSFRFNALSAGQALGVWRFEDRQESIAQILVDRAAGAGDGGDDGVKEPVEEKDHIIRQLPGGAAGKAAHVKKEDGEPALLALSGMGAAATSIFWNTR